MKRIYGESLKINKVKYIAIGLVLMLGAFIGIIGGSLSITKDLASEVIRFHVVANSDSTSDQLLKQRVRDEVIEEMRPYLKDATSIEESRQIILDHLEEINQTALEVVKEWGANYKVYVGLDYANFPMKKYGDVVLPAGRYEACRIIIGEGKGENWWCIMFPPLCYVDAATGVVPIEGKEALKQELNEEQYELIANSQEGKYEVRFKVVDTINSYIHRNDYKIVK